MLLEVDNLHTHLSTGGGKIVKAVDGISFGIDRGETFCLVGESGSGKSMTSLSAMRLIPESILRHQGSIWFDYRRDDNTRERIDLLTLPDSEMRRIRGARISMIFQEPMTSLNPVFTVGDQIMEALLLHFPTMTPREARMRAIEMMDQVRIPDPTDRVGSYPHQMSGGQRQRVMIAMALACKPDMLIADEPTTALDVTVQAEILRLIKDLQQERDTAVLFITHDLSVVSQIADRVAVMQLGKIVEQGRIEQILTDPQHPYTHKLLEAIPENLARRKRDAGSGTPVHVTSSEPADAPAAGDESAPSTTTTGDADGAATSASPAVADAAGVLHGTGSPSGSNAPIARYVMQAGETEAEATFQSRWDQFTAAVGTARGIGWMTAFVCMLLVAIHLAYAVLGIGNVEWDKQSQPLFQGIGVLLGIGGMVAAIGLGTAAQWGRVFARGIFGAMVIRDVLALINFDAAGFASPGVEIMGWSAIHGVFGLGLPLLMSVMMFNLTYSRSILQLELSEQQADAFNRRNFQRYRLDWPARIATVGITSMMGLLLLWHTALMVGGEGPGWMIGAAQLLIPICLVGYFSAGRLFQMDSGWHTMLVVALILGTLAQIVVVVGVGFGGTISGSFGIDVFVTLIAVLGWVTALGLSFNGKLLEGASFRDTKGDYTRSIKSTAARSHRKSMAVEVEGYRFRRVTSMSRTFGILVVAFMLPFLALAIGQAAQSEATTAAMLEEQLIEENADVEGYAVPKVEGADAGASSAGASENVDKGYRGTGLDFKEKPELRERFDAMNAAFVGEQTQQIALYAVMLLAGVGVILMLPFARWFFLLVGFAFLVIFNGTLALSILSASAGFVFVVLGTNVILFPALVIVGSRRAGVAFRFSGKLERYLDGLDLDNLADPSRMATSTPAATEAKPAESAEDRVAREREEEKARRGETLVEIKDLRTYFPIKKGLLKNTVGYVRAVDGVDLTIPRGRILALVGESGCGKTTLGRSILRLQEPSAGRIVYDGLDIMRYPRSDVRPFRREMQFIFQDPQSSLNPRLTIETILTEPMAVHEIGSSREERVELARAALQRVELDPDMIRRYPHEFSGGQRQRIGIARALVLNPRFIVCDEVTSALDVSVQANILQLLQDLREERNLTLLFITHDIGVVEYLADEVAVMYAGKIVERGATDEVIADPQHSYTKKLLGAVPRIEWDMHARNLKDSQAAG